MGTTVSNSTNCFDIAFTTQNTSGTSPLDFQNVIVTNSTGNVIEDISQKDASIVITEDKSSTPKEDNSKPNIPDVPSGPSSGFTNTSYAYLTLTNDPDDDEVYYLFDWGDGTTTTWLGLYRSGNTCISSHFWNNLGTYDIKVKAKDNHDNESSWSTALTIEIQNKTQPPENQTENLSPTAVFTHTPKLPDIQETVQFTDQSIDKDGNITKWLWDFGDGITATEQHPTHQYANNRTYIVTLTAWDNNETTNITYQQMAVSSIISETTENKETPSLGLITFLIAIAIVLILKRKKLNQWG